MSIRLLFLGEAGEFPRRFADKSTALDETPLNSRTSSLEYFVYDHLGTHCVIKKAMEAERDGYDAIIIGCFYDTGLNEARELVEIPVVGICEASLHMAAMVTAEKFSILIGRRKWLPKMINNARRYGLESKIASWRMVDLALEEMSDLEKTKKAVLREAKNAIKNDMAEAVVLGCTEMAGLAEDVQKQLGAPVIDPVLMGIRFAELKARIWKTHGISHSKIGGYEKPPREELERLYLDVFRNWRDSDL